jgi:HSP20 family protein
MAVTRWTPFGDLENLHRHLNQLFTAGTAVPNQGGREDIFHGSWLPPVDILEEEGALTLNVELPGLKREDISIRVEDQVLTICGERKPDTEETRRNYHRVERSYGKFSRSFTLNRQIDVTGIDARFRDGVLTVSLPKREAAKPREITVTVE